MRAAACADDGPLSTLRRLVEGDLPLEGRRLSLVFAVSEVAPWSKTGGLGDVAGALPPALARRGHRVMVVAPRYLNDASAARYAGAADTGVRLQVACFGGHHELALLQEFRDGVAWTFVDHPSFRRTGGPYGDEKGPFGDNLFRFTLLSHAACEAPLRLPARRGEAPLAQCDGRVVFVANDWHTGLVPTLLAWKYRKAGVLQGARCVMAIHNLAYQGVEPMALAAQLGLPDSDHNPPPWGERVAWHGALNPLKGAIVTADRVVTVSETYAREIQAPALGCGLDGVLRARADKLDGIVNGVDGAEWDPRVDPHLAARYSQLSLARGKAACKAALQAELRLPVRPDVPLIGFIGRLDPQKGTELITASLAQILSLDGGCQLVMLGSGRADLEAALRAGEAAHPQRFRGWVGFSVPVSHRITAGCDILLMPSAFEPCGLNQLYAMRYGTVPVVHATGGLADTVREYNPTRYDGIVRRGGLEQVGTGFRFSPHSADAMLAALRAALTLYRHQKERWRLLQIAGMAQDFSWRRAARRWEQAFAWALTDPPVV